MSVISNEETADLLGITEARVSQLRKAPAEPFRAKTLSEVARTDQMKRRSRLASSFMPATDPAIAVSARHRRVIAVTPAGEALFGEPAESLLGRYAAELMLPAPPPPDAEAQRPDPQSDLRRAFSATQLDARAAADGIPVEIRPRQWEEPTPPDGLAIISHGDDVRTDGTLSDADADEVEVMRARRPNLRWGLRDLAEGYPVLGKASVQCKLTYYDVDPGSASPGGRRPAARRDHEVPPSAFRVFRFLVPSLRTQMTRDILGLEYDVRQLADKRDFGELLQGRIEEFFQQKVEEIGQRFLCEYVTLFNFRLRGDQRVAADASGSPRVLVPLGTYGMPKGMSAHEPFRLHDGAQADELDDDGGIIADFLQGNDTSPVYPINFRDPTERDRVKHPNLYNLRRTSRFGDAINGLLVKVRLPQQRPGEHTQLYGCLRLINCFKPGGSKPVPLEFPTELPWQDELVEVAEHLAIMYQQWLRISRRWILSRAVVDLNERSDLKGYVARITRGLQALSEFQHVTVWEQSRRDGYLAPLGSPEIEVPIDGSFCGSAFSQGKILSTDEEKGTYESLAHEQRALHDHARALKSRSTPDEKVSDHPVIALKNGFQVPIESRHSGRWGVMSFYNTWSSPKDKVSLYRDETLDFCSSLARLVAAKRDLGRRSSEAMA